MIFVSIDIGYYNLGIVKADITDGIPHVLLAQKIDLTSLPHVRVPLCQCRLHHTREMADLVLHFIQEYREHLDEADRILVERQPPGGFGAIETLLVATFRDKIEVVSPNSMHKHFSIGHLDYENRKIQTQKIAAEHLEHLESYNRLIRKHDVADAMCMILYRMPRAPRKQLIVKDFNIFRYVPDGSPTCVRVQTNS